MTNFQRSIQDQVDSNKKLLLSLPYYANFAEVWQPENLSYELAIVYETFDRGLDILGQ